MSNYFSKIAVGLNTDANRILNIYIKYTYKKSYCFCITDTPEATVHLVYFYESIKQSDKVQKVTKQGIVNFKFPVRGSFCCVFHPGSRSAAGLRVWRRADVKHLGGAPLRFFFMAAPGASFRAWTLKVSASDRFLSQGSQVRWHFIWTCVNPVFDALVYSSYFFIRVQSKSVI